MFLGCLGLDRPVLYFFKYEGIYAYLRNCIAELVVLPFHSHSITVC